MDSSTAEEELKTILDSGFIKMMDGVPMRSTIQEEAIEKLKKLKVGENNVMVVGYPKTGSHFVLQILAALGYKRMYGEKDKRNWSTDKLLILRFN